MRTNGFAFLRGEGSASLARDVTQRVKRYSRGILVSDGGAFGELDDAGLSGRKDIALAFCLGRGGFPLVHGFVDDEDAHPEGEFSLLGRDSRGFYAARDPLGTRGLWAMRDGPNAGSVASDYRILPGATLLPPGTTYENGRTRSAKKARIEAESVGSFEDAAKELASRIEKSVKRRVQGERRTAVSFSGGLDSSLIALVASRHTEVILCSAYAAGARDESQTSRAASMLGLRLESAVLKKGDLVEMSRMAELPPGDPTLMDRALWCIYSTTSRLAKRNKARVMLLGQLADELFGGYRKYALKAEQEGVAAAERMMRDDVRACADRSFLRDEAACSASCEVRFPYADSRIASLAAALPPDYKIREGKRKAVLRTAALRLGLPEELAEAPKKAAQFSSGAAKLLRRL